MTENCSKVKKWHNSQLLWIERILRISFVELGLTNDQQVPTPELITWKSVIEGGGSCIISYHC
jgi:hypothetical protein